MTGEPGKRHNVRAQLQDAVSDWLNPFSLGTMSASAYIENLVRNSLDQFKSFYFEMVQFEQL